MTNNKQTKIRLAIIGSCLVVLAIFYGFISCSSTNELYGENYTQIEIQNNSKLDSVKVYLTIQAPNSVIGLFGIKPADTTGSKSQGYFWAKKDSSYFLDCQTTLYGFNISFGSVPLPCDQAVKKGFPTGLNIVEGSINCEYESFDISCVDGVNSVLRTSVTDTVNWTTGTGNMNKPFRSAQNNIYLDSNYNIRGVFPYRCSDCIDINPHNVPKNCFDLPANCNTDRICQVNRVNHNGGTIKIEYLGSLEIE
jgi:hypothetical protein